MYLKLMHRFEEFIFGKTSWSISTITNCRVNVKFVNNTFVMSLRNKDNVIKSFVGWDHSSCNLSNFVTS
jgi:hypothetical protein